MHVKRNVDNLMAQSNLPVRYMTIKPFCLASPF